MRLLSLAIAALLLSGWSTAQDEPETDVPTLVRKLRNDVDDPEQRADLIEQLLDAGENGQRQLFNYVRISGKSLQKAWQKDLKRHLRDFANSAPKLLRRRLGKAGPKRVDQLREEMLKHSRDGGLQKSTVTSEIDPRMKELEQLLTIGVDEVLSSDAKLKEQAAELDLGLARLLELFQAQERAEEMLMATKAGRRFVENYEIALDPRSYAENLKADRELLALKATPMSSRDAKVLEQNRVAERELDPEEAAGIRKLNRIRIFAGIGAVAIDLKLCNAARDHSADMKRLGFFSHTSPVEGKQSFGQRAALAGTSARSENIARGQRSGHGAIRAWWYSPGHHRNMMAGSGRVGLGRDGSFWTQMFGG